MKTRRKKRKLIPFVNNKGQVIHLDPKLTIKDLVKLGVTDIKLTPNDQPQPLPDNWWQDKG